MEKARQIREVPQGKSPGYSVLPITLFSYRFTHILELEKYHQIRTVLTERTRARGPSRGTEIFLALL